ncbi:hypothetical protein [Vibrio sp. HN007]|uniref:hypothetical protein n=1 Tax=Vibrio iocasae TaxID=3098914 RepID=UPI0035D4ADE0
MDTSDLIPDYTQRDFEDATRALLPKGQYWQGPDNQELTSLIEGMAIDFKKTHDEVQLALLTEFSDSLFGWKIRDYQTLLNESGSTGTVYDDVNSPNLIKIDLFSYDNDRVFAEFEKKRLPHTEFAWNYPFDANTEFNQSTALAITPELSSELELTGNTQFTCSTAIAWQLEIGENT